MIETPGTNNGTGVSTTSGDTTNGSSSATATHLGEMSSRWGDVNSAYQQAAAYYHHDSYYRSLQQHYQQPSPSANTNIGSCAGLNAGSSWFDSSNMTASTAASSPTAWSNHRIMPPPPLYYQGFMPTAAAAAAVASLNSSTNGSSSSSTASDSPDADGSSTSSSSATSADLNQTQEDSTFVLLFPPSHKSMDMWIFVNLKPQRQI